MAPAPSSHPSLPLSSRRPVRPPRPPSLLSPSAPLPPLLSTPLAQSPSTLSAPIHIPSQSTYSNRYIGIHDQALDDADYHGAHHQHNYAAENADKDEEQSAGLRFASALVPSPPNAGPPVPPVLPFGNTTVVTTGDISAIGASSRHGADIRRDIPNPMGSGIETSENTSANIQHGAAGSTDDLALDCDSAIALFSHAVLLFDSYCWHQSLRLHRSILRRGFAFSEGSDEYVLGGSSEFPSWTRPQRTLPKSPPLPKVSRLWFNIGVIRCHLGEYALAVEALDHAVEADQKLAVAWYVMGMALFELQDFRRAERRFKMALLCFEEDAVEGGLGPTQIEEDDDEIFADGAGQKARRTEKKLKIMQIDYRSKGLSFVLERTRVEFNVRLSLLWKLHRQVKAERPPQWTLNRLPAGKIFQPVDHSVNSNGGSGARLGRINGLVGFDENKVAPWPEPPTGIDGFGDIRSRPTPSIPRMRAQSAPSKSPPTWLTRKLIPKLLRHRNNSSERKNVTDTRAVGDKEGEKRRFLGKVLPFSSKMKQFGAQGSSTVVGTSAAGLSRPIRIESLDMFASSMYEDVGARNVEDQRGSNPREFEEEVPQFKPLPPLPTTEPPSTSTSLPVMSPVRDTVENLGCNSPRPTDSFIAARRQSAFAALNTAREPPKRIKREMMRRVLLEMQETHDVEDDRESIISFRKTETEKISAPRVVPTVAAGTEAGLGISVEGNTASPEARAGEGIIEGWEVEEESNGASADAPRRRREVMDSMQIFHLGLQQPSSAQQQQLQPPPQRQRQKPNLPFLLPRKPSKL